jgi:hypothetical protein
VYKVPELSEDKLNDLADGFLIGVDIKDIPPSQQRQARNLTASIYVVQQGDVNVTMNFASEGVGEGIGGAVRAVGFEFCKSG